MLTEEAEKFLPLLPKLRQRLREGEPLIITEEAYQDGYGNDPAEEYETIVVSFNPDNRTRLIRWKKKQRTQRILTLDNQR